MFSWLCHYHIVWRYSFFQLQFYAIWDDLYFWVSGLPVTWPDLTCVVLFWVFLLFLPRMRLAVAERDSTDLLQYLGSLFPRNMSSNSFWHCELIYILGFLASGQHGRPLHFFNALQFLFWGPWTAGRPHDRPLHLLCCCPPPPRVRLTTPEGSSSDIKRDLGSLLKWKHIHARFLAFWENFYLLGLWMAGPSCVWWFLTRVRLNRDHSWCIHQ